MSAPFWLVLSLIIETLPSIDMYSNGTLTADHSMQTEKSRKLHRFNPFDLLVINGKLNGTVYDNLVAMCTNHNEDFTQVILLKITLKIKTNVPALRCKHIHKQGIFPNHMLRPLSIKTSKNASLSLRNRHEIEVVLDSLRSTNEWRKNKGDIPLICFGIFAWEFGLHGFFYSFNYLRATSTKPNMDETQPFFDKFYETYLRQRPRSLANLIISNTIRTGDFIKIHLNTILE